MNTFVSGVILIHVVFSLFVYFVILIKNGLKINSKNVKIKEGSRVLFVIAHPDDEAMFYAPLIINMIQHEKSHVSLLCLSSGTFLNLNLDKYLLYQAILNNLGPCEKGN